MDAIPDTTPEFSGTDSPREIRVLRALVNGPTTREDVDRIARASNGPDVVYRLRAKGADILTDLVPHTTADGERSRHGLYSLSPDGRRAVQEWLRGTAGTAPRKALTKWVNPNQDSTEAAR